MANTDLSKFYSNESKIRLIAFFVLLLLILYAVTHLLIVPVFLIIDFALRAAGQQRFSPLANVSEWQVKQLGLPVKPVFLPPKRFAARIGFFMCVAIGTLHIFNIDTRFITAILILFAGLESLAGFCAGCYLYVIIQKLKKAPVFKIPYIHGEEEDWR